MFIFILVMINREQRWMGEYLREEVALGTLNLSQYRTACYPLERLSAHLDALRNGQGRVTGHFYQQLAELAHKKRQLALLGDEGGNTRIVSKLRDEIALLSPNAFPRAANRTG
jgi:hypothetical protein